MARQHQHLCLSGEPPPTLPIPYQHPKQSAGWGPGGTGHPGQDSIHFLPLDATSGGSWQSLGRQTQILSKKNETKVSSQRHPYLSPTPSEKKGLKFHSSGCLPPNLRHLVARSNPRLPLSPIPTDTILCLLLTRPPYLNEKEPRVVL